MYQHAQGLAGSNLEPAELVDKIHLGDTVAESAFVNRYSRSLLLLLRNRIKDDEFAVNECAQEAFLTTLEKMRAGKIREPEKIAAFLRKTAIYISINYYRQQKRFVALSHDNIIHLRTNANTAEAEIYSRQINSILREVLIMLPMNRDREILENFFLQEQPKIEVCRKLGLSIPHFDRVLSRAKKRLRKTISNNEPLEALLRSQILENAYDYE